jgi:hypothetical protein
MLSSPILESKSPDTESGAVLTKSPSDDEQILKEISGMFGPVSDELRRIRAAQEDAKVCGLCVGEIGSEIFLLLTDENGRVGSGTLKVPCCLSCVRTVRVHSKVRPLRNAGPCEGCGRTVYRSRRLRSVCCSQKCRKTIEAAQVKAKRRRLRREESHCQHCGKVFVCTRSHARYCGALCRQRAYLQRSRQHILM